ncbi:TPA: glycosyltransferase [Candidatus Berkelbacteria bacterium]|uniref:WecB/TagA/CpsF family glycosyl transferase, N-acetylglucosaminyldiphosphoundecaprenol n=1 Tax=Berkelbacteria bacterium GW2011_GWE1_39_12 TaxID=1618337 RepID=A0A0G4B4B5_9BACT|nr:MAG: WecB/TagA/CpsF family glycosyl transferase, N-acetylglucosaminyldiphosphoundecaprenol [Berkelbacteria bacterium GW2011_GWE1_39_12]HBO60139.1 glycosyltransferase [Candidatus Berkelbacteria bacterium]
MKKILGVAISEYSFSEVMQKITGFLQSNNCHLIATVNPEFVVAAQKDEEFKNILNNADLNVPDGFGLKCAAVWKRIKIGERITGVDLTWEMAKIASEKGYSIYLLGGKKGVAEMTARRLRYLYHNLKIAGTYAGSPEEEGIIQKINDSKVDILLVAFGAPKQEKFIAQHKNELQCKVAMGVGGTFDYISGALPRAPKFMRALGLEWLYRLFKQPSRIGRIYNAVIKFPILVVFSRSK